jgi:hypothetical protein
MVSEKRVIKGRGERKRDTKRGEREGKGEENKRAGRK